MISRQDTRPLKLADPKPVMLLIKAPEVELVPEPPANRMTLVIMSSFKVKPS
jgi:hypothetical protein